MDRIQSTTTLAAPTLPYPSYAGLLLTETADQLDDGQPFLILTPETLGEAMAEAARLVLHGLPQIVADAARAGAARANLEFRDRETAGEFALRLRAAAGGL